MYINEYASVAPKQISIQLGDPYSVWDEYERCVGLERLVLMQVAADPTICLQATFSVVELIACERLKRHK